MIQPYRLGLVVGRDFAYGVDYIANVILCVSRAYLEENTSAGLIFSDRKVDLLVVVRPVPANI